MPEAEAARWRLTGKHYLPVPGTEWEYREVDRNSGKMGRSVYSVPLYLDPEDPGAQNYPGEIIVANAESRAYPRDIIFTGKPTPDMEPLNDEADKITEACRPLWVHPIDSIPGQGGNYGDMLIKAFEKQFDALLKANGGVLPQPAAVSEGMVPKAEFEALQKQVAELMARLDTKPAVERRA